MVATAKDCNFTRLGLLSALHGFLAPLFDPLESNNLVRYVAKTDNKIEYSIQSKGWLLSYGVLCG